MRKFIRRPAQIQQRVGFQDFVATGASQCNNAFKILLRCGLVRALHFEDSARTGHVAAGGIVKDGAVLLRVRELLLRLVESVQRDIGSRLQPELPQSKLARRKRGFRVEQGEHLLIPTLPMQDSRFQDDELPSPLWANSVKGLVATVCRFSGRSNLAAFKRPLCLVEGGLRITPLKAG